MSLALLIYAVSVLGNLTFAFAAAFVGLGMVLVVSAVMIAASYENNDDDLLKSAKKYFKISIISLVGVCFLKVIIPSEKTAWLMVAGYAAEQVYNSESGDKLKQIVNNKLDEILTEQLKEKKK